MPVFDFTSLDEIERGFQDLAIAPVPPTRLIGEDNLRTLWDLADEWGIDHAERQATGDLARGDADFVVLLLEPTEIRTYTDLNTLRELTPTLREVNEALQQASRSARDLNNTCVIDARPFRNAQRREAEDEATRKTNDERAYRCMADVIGAIQPRVILSAQCGTRDAEHVIAKALSSSMRGCGRLCMVRNGETPTLLVKSFHPSTYRDDYLESWRESAQRGVAIGLGVQVRKYVLQHAFKLSFAVALHALQGVRVSGFGLANLRSAIAHNAPVIRCKVREGHVYMTPTWQCVGPDDVASARLLAHLRRLDPLRDLDTVTQLLAKLARTDAKPGINA